MRLAFREWVQWGTYCPRHPRTPPDLFATREDARLHAAQFFCDYVNPGETQTGLHRLRVRRFRTEPT